MEETIYEFNALITSSKYYSEDTAWGCYKFSTTDDIPHYVTTDPDYSLFESNNSQSDNDKKFGTLVGRMQELMVNGEYFVKATFKVDKKYGEQYVVQSIYALVPQTQESQILFLKSIISERVAENLIKAYPNIVNDVANGTIDTIDYSLVNGVRKATWTKIKDKIIQNYLISDIITLLQPLGVTFTMIKKLLEDEPNPSLLKKKLDDNPYILTKLDGLGFKRVDQLALKLNPELRESTERLVAYVNYYFRELGESGGHTWCLESALRKSISSMIPECSSKVDWMLENADFLHIENGRVGLKYYYDTEMDILKLITEKSKIKKAIEIPEEIIEKAIKESEEEQGFTYVEEQLQVIRRVLTSNVSIITGKAGTGKSSIMRAIIKAYKLANAHISASALSAMAAQRITEATGFPAMTIHRTLGCTGVNKFSHDKEHPLDINLAFMDEGSMVNASLMLKWLEAISDKTSIIIAGDHKQLPPIGFGNAFSDLIEVMDKNIVNKLNKPMRQAQRSGILVDANLIRENINPIKENLVPRIIHGELQDMFYMFRDNRQSLFNIAIKTFLSSIKTDGLDNVVIITPRKKNCLNSTFEINKVIQEHLLGNEPQEISNSVMTFKLGAKVMQTVNDYDNNVFNGEVGYITKIGTAIDENKKEVLCAEVTYKDSIKDNKVIKYKTKDLLNLDLAYAMTTHKCQGIGKKTVIGIIDNTHYQLLDNCMLYTMLTRAKKRCLLLAEPQAFLKCIRTSQNKRDTWLLQQ